MAFNILVTFYENSVDWERINFDLNFTKIDGVEIFPIPDFDNIGKQGMGISIIAGRAIPTEAVRKIIKYFIERGDRVVELYNGDYITDANIDKILLSI